MSPQLVDLNADGHQDMVMATFEGTAFLVEGSDKGWKAPKHITDKNDSNVRISMYYDTEKNDYMSVDRSTDDYKSNENHHMTSMSVVDWDADGDHDLLLGAYEGALYLCMNEGTPSDPKFAEHNLQVKAGGSHVTFNGGLATPRVVDWDGDGLFDILCGGSEGGVELLHNVGEKGKPKFGEAKTLIAAHKDPMSIESKNGAPTCPGTSFHVEAIDYDKDGDMDLLVGAKTYFQPEAKELSEEEAKELAELQEKMDAIEEEMDEMMQKVDQDDEDAMNEIFESKEFNKISEKSWKLMQKIDVLQPSGDEVNRIWLYRNKANGPSEKSTVAAATTEASYTAPTDFDPAKFEVRAQLHRTGDDTGQLVVFVNVPKGYHIYGHKSNIEPTTLNVSETDGLDLAGDANVPLGRMVVKTGSPAYWLENVVTITQDIKIKGDLDSVSGNIGFMICNDKGCRPPDEAEFTAKWVQK